MSTELAQQLRQLAVATGVHVGKKPRGKPSLLYSYQEAADIDLQTIYGVGLQGEIRAAWLACGRSDMQRGSQALRARMHAEAMHLGQRAPPDRNYSLRAAGYDQLCRLDARFEPFGRTLFATASTSLDRDQQAPEVNAKLDASIDAFCCLLSSYFLLAPAFKALEYLVRRYR